MNNIKLKVNDKEVLLKVNPSSRLLDVLRDELNLTGVKEGCGEGECGACAVLLNGKLVNSCLVPLANASEAEIVTVEGLSKTKQGACLINAYTKEGAVQCGFCTPGMLLASHALLSENPNPSDEEIRIGLSGNLCRCTGYQMIIDAVKRAAKEGEGLW